MGRRALVTGGTSKDVAAMGVLAINLKEVMPNIADELIIFHDGIKKSDQDIIQGIFPTRFIKFEFPLSFLDMRKNDSLRYFSPMVFCKYECFRLLCEYDMVMWTDYDVVFLRDISELWDEEKGLTIVRENSPVKDMFSNKVGGYDLSEFDLQKPGYSTPLFVVSRKIGNYQKYYDWCIKATRRYIGCIYLPEQCIISLMIQKFNIPYSTIDTQKYVCSVREEYSDEGVSILHCVGRPKFWEGRENIHWQRYYDMWLSMGGSCYRQPLKEKLIEKKEWLKSHLLKS